MSSIRKVTNGWQIMYRWPKGRHGTQRGKTCPDLKTARRLRAEIDRSLALGIEPRPGDAQAPADLEVMFDEYLADRKRFRQKATVIRHGEALALFVTFLRRRRPRARLTPDLLSRKSLRDFWNFCTTAGGERGALGPATANRRVQQVLCTWNWLWDSEEYGHLIDRPKTIDLPKIAAKTVVAPTWQEMDLCVAAARGWHKQLAIVLRFTGLRVSQAMGLLWDDVDLQHGEARVRIVKGDEQPRTIPLSPHLVAELAGWGRREGYLIPSNRQSGPRERQARSRELERAWARSGVRKEVWAAPDKHSHGAPHHTFRAGLISGLTRLRADATAIEWLVGHKLPGVTGGHYLDAAMLPLRETVELIPALHEDAGVDVVLIEPHKKVR